MMAEVVAASAQVVVVNMRKPAEGNQHSSSLSHQAGHTTHQLHSTRPSGAPSCLCAVMCATNRDNILSRPCMPTDSCKHTTIEHLLLFQPPQLTRLTLLHAAEAYCMQVSKRQMMSGKSTKTHMLSCRKPADPEERGCR